MIKLLKKYAGQWQLQLMTWPAVVSMVIFSFIPMAGLIIIFQDYSPLDGFVASPFVGLDNFKAFLGDSEFYAVVWNTLAISLLKLFVGFPFEILLAVMIYELRTGLFKRFAQTVSYLPHFMSWVVLGGMLGAWLGSNGLLNNALMAAGLTQSRISFLGDANKYYLVATLSDIWKEAGWGTILYLAAMSGIDPGLYEAAKMDGAGRFKRIWHITLPSILGIIVLMFVLRVGGVLGANMDQVLVLQNAANKSRSEILDLYVYHMGLNRGDFSFAAAIGVFTSVVSVILLLIANFLTRKLNDRSIF